jgi:hypothetical protein
LHLRGRAFAYHDDNKYEFNSNNLTIDPVVEFSAENDLGEITNELDTPSAVKQEILRNVGKGRTTGLVLSCRYAVGMVGRRPTDVLIELISGGEIEYVVPVPLSGWLAFQLSAARRGLDAKAWLAAVLAKQKQSAARRQTAAQGKSAATRKALSRAGRGCNRWPSLPWRPL